MLKFRPVSFDVAGDITAKPLTAAERRWLEDLNKVLQACPSKRLAAATSGGPDLSIYDSVCEADPGYREEFEESGRDAIPFLQEKGLHLAKVHATFNIDSTAA